MGKWNFRKPEAKDVCGVCVRCNSRPQSKASKDRYMAICRNCKRQLYGKGKRNKFSGASYKRHKKDICESCSFIPINECQLDVDHIDGNHKNNSPDNLRTLCANCHRLKTFMAKEGVYKFHKKILYE